MPVGVGHAHLVEDVDGAYFGFCIVHLLMEDDSFSDLVAHRIGWI